jgi:hypothetical protein
MLHKLPGNARAYFSLTGMVYERGRDVAGGCIHDELLAAWPDLAALAALHLSDDDGVPMHALENGWYWAGGTKWQTANADTLRKHLRCDAETAAALIAFAATQDRAAFDAAVNAMRPRWKQEADAAIKQYGLVVEP